MQSFDVVNTFLHNLYEQEVIRSEDKAKTTLYRTELQNSISVSIDRYSTCKVILPQGVVIPTKLKDEIAKLSECVASSTVFNSIWISVELPNQANIFGQLPNDWEIGNPQKGNIIHDIQSNPNTLSIWKWFNSKKECSLPPGATHNLGATLALIDSISQKILLVQSSRRKDAWCMPGGNFDRLHDGTQNTFATAKRECFEETGVNLDGFEGIQIGEIEFPENKLAPALNKVWRVDFNNGSDHAISLPNPKEILQAVWIPFENVRSGSYENIEIGKEVLAAIQAQGGFRKLAGSKPTKTLYFAS